MTDQPIHMADDDNRTSCGLLAVAGVTTTVLSANVTCPLCRLALEQPRRAAMARWRKK